MLTRDDWPRLSERLTLDVTTLEALDSLEERLEDVRRRAVERGRDADRPLAARWSELTREALEAGCVLTRRVSPSTLLAAAAEGAEPGSLEAYAEAEAVAMGANLRAPIYPARAAAGPNWTMYKGWLETAAELDAGDLRTMAWANPAFAVREAIVLVRPSRHFRYDDQAWTLVLGEGGVEIELDVEAFVFMSLMNGRLPDHLLAVGLEEAETRLDRLAAYLGAMGTAGDARVRFAGARPVLLVGERLVVDPVGESALAGATSVDHAVEHVRAAVDDAFRTACTCDGARRPRVALRPRADVFSFDSAGLDEDEPLYEPTGSSHCLVYEFACEHSAARPSRVQWEKAGWPLERCRAEWEAEPVAGRLLAAETQTWLSRSVLVWGIEVAALAARPDLASALARRLRFQGGSQVALFAPTANVLFVTNEEARDEPTLREAFERGGLAGVLESEWLPPGPPVRFLTATTASPSAALAVEVDDLVLGGDPPRSETPPAIRST
jgi:hypothetical protein